MTWDSKSESWDWTFSSAGASFMLPWPCRLAAWRMGRGKGKCTGNVPILFLPFPTSLGNLCEGERGLNIASVLMLCSLAEHVSLAMPLCTQESNWVLGNLWGSVINIVRTKLTSQLTVPGDSWFGARFPSPLGHKVLGDPSDRYLPTLKDLFNWKWL